ncbi:MAG TPA: hypothetical protein VF071_03630 [Candidatus Limnocylindria bacterium]
MTISQDRWTVVLLAVLAALALAACEPDAESSGNARGDVQTISSASAVAAIEQMDGSFNCAEPIRRADDFAWICEGSRQPMTATVHVYALEPDGPVFGVTIYTQAPAAPEREQAVDATADLARDVIQVAVPQQWREAAATWISEHLPDGGRTLDVPDAGITASVQPLAGLQWYMELYELDGLQS